MNKILMVAAVACLSAAAVAQSTPSSKKPAGASKDRESSTPSVSELTVTKPATGSKPVATGDLNGDGHADVAASRNSAHATESATGAAAGRESSQPTTSEAGTAKPASSSNNNGTREAASGHPTGKRQHEPITIQK